MGFDNFCDYASAPPSIGGSTWGSPSNSNQMQELYRYLGEMSLDDTSPQRNNSLNSLSHPVDDVMEEFRLNGSDSPYDPDEDDVWGTKFIHLSGMGPPSGYLRQKSWPAPDASPAAPLPPVSALGCKRAAPDDWSYEGTSSPASAAVALLTAEQRQALASLPTATLRALLTNLSDQPALLSAECRFCKRNGEREAFFRSHTLKDGEGRVRCPVLRAFVCRRCGAQGDNAHTLKYCPFATDKERQKSATMMRSVRLASGRRRYSAPSSGAVTQLAADWTTPLDPAWAALERKLLE